MYAHGDYEYDVFISYPWSHPEGRWVTRVFAPTLQGQLRNAFPHWEPRLFFDKNEVEVGDVLEQEILSALRRSCVLVPVLCYPYFRSSWCAAEWRTFQTPLLEASGASGRPRSVAPTIYAGDPNHYPPRARSGGGLAYHQLSEFNTLQQPTQRFRKQVQVLAHAVASLMLKESRPPDPGWPAFSGASMEDLRRADPHGIASEWMLVPPPVIRKPVYGAERVA